MNFNRHAIAKLKSWKGNKERKPLILRGARQVGKTTLVMEFAKSYDYFISLNLEKSTDKAFFDAYEDVSTIVDALFLSNNITPDQQQNTLLFIDEIQELPKAIQLLRYFYEDIPKLHVIAAGSLLEFAMRRVESFPVGRVEFLYLYPLNFKEYLQAIGHTMASEQLANVPIRPIAHRILLKLFHRYAIIGGMPEVVKRDIGDGNLANLPTVYESIWGTYKEDVEKYTSNATERTVVKHIMDTAHLYIDRRIKFQSFGNSNYRSREVGKAIRNLDAAKIIQLIYPTTDLEPPIKPDIKKSPRLQFLDTGMVNYSLEIQAQLLAMDDLSNAFKGTMIPHLITQELISLNTITNTKPHFWVREKRQSSSEVDLVYSYGDKIIPIEIKSGATGALKSLHQFMDRVGHPYAIRMYAGEYKVEELTTIEGKPYLLMNLPYYLGTQLPEYIDYFVNNYA
ncbi:ATP-binding protein [Flagellimonas algicola]|uniref:ATP-binding protein n=1 Tax=Flagellimonas algicola TaxID=2583815 RepID=A0ABY2WGV2_9FLAO|nr:AAA family ATPase [Allomuricauda algicola]TMU50781.1 ATP-binding protein [Allomuricauda algicola]